MLEIDFREGENTSVVVIDGSIDGLTAESLLKRMMAHLTEGHSQIVADLSKVAYTSSAGLRALLATVKQARSQGGDLRIAAPTDNVKKVLELSGFASIMKLFDTVEEAEASYS